MLGEVVVFVLVIMLMRTESMAKGEERESDLGLIDDDDDPRYHCMQAGEES